MPKSAVFERYCRELSLDVWVGVHILLDVEQSSLKVSLGGVARLRYLRYLLDAPCIILLFYFII